MLAALTGRAEFRTVDIDATGNSFYDQLLVVDALFKERFSGIGMAIMVLFGFVSYMHHIGADAKAVVILSSPLKRFEGSYWLVPVGFLIGSLLSLVVPSASALSLLLVATLLPALIAAGLTPPDRCRNRRHIVYDHAHSPRSGTYSRCCAYRYAGDGIRLRLSSVCGHTNLGNYRLCTHVVATPLR